MGMSQLSLDEFYKSEKKPAKRAFNYQTYWMTQSYQMKIRYL